MAVQHYFTVGEIAKAAKCPIHRIRYMIQRLGVEPAVEVGKVHGYSESTARGIIVQALASKDTEKRRAAELAALRKSVLSGKTGIKAEHSDGVSMRFATADDAPPTPLSEVAGRDVDESDGGGAS